MIHLISFTFGYTVLDIYFGVTDIFVLLKLLDYIHFIFLDLFNLYWIANYKHFGTLKHSPLKWQRKLKNN